MRPELFLTAGVALAAAWLAGCDKTEEPALTNPTGAPAATVTAAAATKPSASPAGGSTASPVKGTLTWDAPAPFTKSAAPNPMRLATYIYPKAAGDTEDAELAVSTAGGTVEQNVRRWVGQFEAATYESTKQSTVKAGPLDVTLVELEGNYAGMMMPGKAAPGVRTKWAMLAAIVPVGGGSYFFKFTGPSATVKAARADFDKVIASLRLQASP